MRSVLFFLLCAPLWVLAQSDKPASAGASADKGATPLSSPQGTTPHSSLRTPHSTRAVVVGISNYQSPQIPPLRFAHRDAEAFAAWLRSPAGGNLPEDNMRILLNEAATQGAFTMALDWLMEQSAPGDLAVIYFSGHGDVEKKIVNQPGYLLCRDAPPKVYFSGGTVSLDLLQGIITTIAVEKKARVLLVTDACHAGKLAGSESNGSQVTNSNLAQLFSNATKILACQPNEYALESEQWGGGRGLFSYHLVDGLHGLADGNNDQTISLLEIQQYLQIKVPADAAPAGQMPVVSGNLTEKVAWVDKMTLDSLRQQRSRVAQQLEPSELRGIVEDLLAQADAATKSNYQAFDLALKEHRLLDSSGQCANDFYLQLIQVELLKPIYGHLRRDYAAVLIDEVQQAINALLADDPYEINNWRYNRDKYAEYPALAGRTIELLGEGHPLYADLQAKRLFFEAYKITAYPYGWSGAQGVETSKKQARDSLHKAMQYAPMAPYLFYLLGNTFLGSPHQDSIQLYYGKAIDLSPGWLLPRLEMAWHILDTGWRFEEAGDLIRQSLAINPDSYQALEMLTWWCQRYDLIDSIETTCARIRALRPDLPNDYVALLFTHLKCTKNYEKAIEYARKAIAVNPNECHYHLAEALFLAKRPAEAAKEIALAQEVGEPSYFLDFIMVGRYAANRKWHSLDSLYKRILPRMGGQTDRAYLLAKIGKFQVHLGHPDSAKVYFENALKTWPRPGNAQTIAWSWLGVIAQNQGRIEEAEAYFKQAEMLPRSIWSFDNKADGAELFVLYGNFLMAQNRPQEAEEKIRTAIELDSGNYLGYYAMARYHAGCGRTVEALDYLEKALERYYPIPDPIQEEPLFSKLRKTRRYKELLTRYFPESVK